MSAREVIARACTPTPDECFHGSGSIAPGASEFHCLVKMWEREIPRADAIISDLRAAGHVILSPDEVRAAKRVVEIANRNEASPEGSLLARLLKGGRDVT
ncbi:hypothetical protein [Aquamicrobium defluvii]|uniref:Uncharacterized protein n=1 Tax=Aquamicrobium defluvii TaxID=69279 RepID=A0A011TDI6_9HYPH|nr:hypothetical protein [Aquamicrobium defluvii]EXL09734.1 hypothetical protein BG36_21060 [Aquamicrobium defluvii]EZQ16482.1 hypothetical protein CF98_40660 [Halopseudomonas bauzanensis]